MTKSLTEKWKDGELEQGYYYIRWSFDCDDEPSYMIDFCDTENFTRGTFINKQWKFIDEVVYPVPSYDHFSQLVKKVKKLQEQLDEAKTENNNLLNDIVDLNLTIQHKEEQLKEANEVIESLRTYDFTVDDENAEYYQVKWNVEAKRFYKNRKWGVK